MLLHPELSHIQDEYNRVLDSYEAGHISYEQTLETITSLTAVDGAGWVWSIDTATGSFMRAAPGGPSEIIDASAFVPSQLGATPNPLTRPPVPNGQPSWQTQSPAQTPPAFPGPEQPTYEAPGYDTDYGQPQMSQPPFDQGFAPGPTPGPGQAPSRGRQGRSINDTGAPSPIDRLKALTSGRGRTVLIVLGVLLLIFVVYASQKKSPATTPIPNGSTTTAPVTTPTTAPTTTIPPTTAPHSTTAPTTPATTAPPPPALPSASQMNSVLASLGTGNRSVAKSLVVNPGSARTLATQTAFYAGFAQTGATVASTPAAASGSNIVSTIRITDKPTQIVLYTGQAKWTQTTSGWKLVTWPAYQAP